jgi:hypothetical protein
MIDRECREEIWLKGNSRYAWTGMLLPGALTVVFAILAGAVWNSVPWLAILAMIAFSLMLVICIAIFLNAKMPRIVLKDDSVLFYLPGPRPIVVPLDYVECFLMASGVTTLPGNEKKEVQTQNIVIRLAERVEEEWGHREIPIEIGKWCQGQITIRGLYSEPIDVNMVQRLNVKLYEAQHGTVPSAPQAMNSTTGSPNT